MTYEYLCTCPCACPYACPYTCPCACLYTCPYTRLYTCPYICPYTWTTTENCYFSNQPGLKAVAVKNALLEEIKKQLQDGGIGLPDRFENWEWRSFMPAERSGNFYRGIFLPEQRTRAHLEDAAGVTWVTCSSDKQDAVDRKFIAQCMAFARNCRDPHYRLAVIIAGDKDFMDCVREMRAQGIRVMMIHAGTDHSLWLPSECPIPPFSEPHAP